ncbi:Ribosomal_protein L29e [Hexamita inflata]|uniref:60S ribosomal protein L29 n=1 Tax=Hexamita inflata TaxID=28002 RepID=A0AA86QMV7_9EUKA|nr:Ribosomal protein L29e [Hexamita inflata]CAI9950545.1 Ribosomal protein L29e [Hexamita inflata]CAI9959512.1 Ribosomal protein L29e [Hexamita inflata]
MSKSKVHSSKGNNRKAHRNGIKKVQKHTSVSPVGVNQKYLLNAHRSRVGKTNKAAEKK